MNYYGPRNIEFVQLIRNILRVGKLKQKYIDLLTSEDSLTYYNIAFTHKSIDPLNNYEFFENMGDITVNKCIVWYVPRRFPQLMNPEAVPIIARLRINIGSKEYLSRFADSWNMWKFISMNEELRQKEKKKTLEDVFEAFIGCTELLIDSKMRLCAGYDICYNIMKAILDNENMSLRYDDLFDPKTRLKELFDFYNKDSEFGTLEYTDERIERKGDISQFNQDTHVKIYRVLGAKKGKIISDAMTALDRLSKKTLNQVERNDIISTKNSLVHLSSSNVQKQLIGYGVGPTKAQAEQIASQNALNNFKKEGYEKPIPEIYRKFSS